MADRDLLEMAAKALGLGRQFWDYEWVRGLGHMVTRRSMWNPLGNDGEALMLAASLRISINFTSSHTECEIGEEIFSEEHMGEPWPATRRAIVRAAAELGRLMP